MVGSLQPMQRATSLAHRYRQPRASHTNKSPVVAHGIACGTSTDVRARLLLPCAHVW